MIATMATLAGFPALTMASYLALNSGFNRMALSGGMLRACLARGHPPRMDRFTFEAAYTTHSAISREIFYPQDPLLL
jgi:hypothetical protein